MLRTLMLTASIAFFAFAMPAHAVLTKYDDFNSAPLSSTLWTSTTGGTGTVTFNGTTAFLSLPAGTSLQAPKWAVIQSSFRPNLVSNGDTFRMSWDQSIAGTLTNAFRIGLFVLPSSGDPTAPLLLAGQFGLGDSAARDLEFLLGPSAAETTSNVDPATGTLYHYDLSLSLTNSVTGLVSSTLLVYTHESGLNNTPETYFSSRTPLATLTESHVWADTTDLTVVYGPTFAGANTNTGTQHRGDLTLDNVFLDLPPVLPVPEPNSFMLLGMGLLALRVKRRRRN